MGAGLRRACVLAVTVVLFLAWYVYGPVQPSGAGAVKTGGPVVALVAGDGVSAEVSDAPFRIRFLDGAGHEITRESGTGDPKWNGLTYSSGGMFGAFLQPLEASIAVPVDLVSFRLDRVLSTTTVPGGARFHVSTKDLFAPSRTADVTVTAQGPRRLRVRMSLSDDTGIYRLRESFVAAPDEHFSGFGERFGTSFDQRGRSFVLGADRLYTGPELFGVQLGQNDHFAVPFLLSSKGYGVSVRDSGKEVGFDLASPNANVGVASFGVGTASGALEYDFYAGDPATVLGDYTADVGRSRVLPEWAYGVWKGHDKDPTQAELLDEFDQWRAHSLPVDVAMIDSPWETTYNTWQWNPEQFPDAQGMLDSLAADGLRPIVWNAGWLNTDSTAGDRIDGPQSSAWAAQPAPNYAPAAAAGLFVRNADGTPYVGKWWMGTGSILDFTNPATRAFWSNTLAPVLRMGVYGVKIDGEEGSYIPADVRFADGRTGAQGAWDLTRAYRQATDDALTAVHGDDDVTVMRSGSTGSQGRGGMWAGDQFSTPTGFRQVFTAALTAAASGVSNWQTDAGGYFGRIPTILEILQMIIANPGKPVSAIFGGLAPPKSLYLRWVEAATFNTTFEMFSRAPNEPWLYDDETTSIVRRFTGLHEQLVPYIRAMATIAHDTGLPVLRPLALVWPAEQQAWATSDEWLFGDSLLVAPVLDPAATSRQVWLPPGQWIDYWTGAVTGGGTTVAAAAPLDHVPLWVRAGAVIPSYPADVTALTPGTDPRVVVPAGRLDVRVWPGGPGGGRVTLAGGSVITAEAGNVTWTGTPAASLLVRFPLAAAPAVVTSGGTPLAHAPDLATVQTARTGWFYDSVAHELWAAAAGTSGDVTAN